MLEPTESNKSNPAPEFMAPLRSALGCMLKGGDKYSLSGPLYTEHYREGMPHVYPIFPDNYFVRLPKSKHKALTTYG